jgi:ribosome-associated translation inhibitor RaiA
MSVQTDMLNEARRDITDVIEEVGAVCTHLREAMDFADNGSVLSAVACVDDAQAAIDNAIRELTKIRDMAGRWAVWADGKERAS